VRRFKLLVKIPYYAQAFCASIGLAAWSLPCQAQETLNIDVHDPRPLRTALQEMELHSIRPPLIYEESVYASPEDLATMTDGSGKPVKYPRGGHFKVQIPTHFTDAKLVMQDLVTAYHNENLSGVYQVVQRNKMVEILPLQHKSNEGKLVDSRPVLKTHITFAAQPRSVYWTAKAFADTLSKAIGHPVNVGNTYMQSEPLYEIGAEDEAADDFLGRLNDLMGGIIVYLNYNPQDQSYWLALHFAARAQPDVTPITPTPSNAPNPFFVREKK
jgi:hypothetical protein